MAVLRSVQEYLEWVQEGSTKLRGPITQIKLNVASILLRGVFQIGSSIWFKRIRIQLEGHAFFPNNFYVQQKQASNVAINEFDLKLTGPLNKRHLFPGFRSALL